MFRLELLLTVFCLSGVSSFIAVSPLSPLSPFMHSSSSSSRTMIRVVSSLMTLNASKRKRLSTSSIKEQSSSDSSVDAVRVPLDQEAEEVSSSSSSAQVLGTRRRRVNHKVRELMRLVQETLDNDEDEATTTFKNSSAPITAGVKEEYKKTRTFFYHNSPTLDVAQVQDVLAYLLKVFSNDKELVRLVVQSTPRIFKRSVKTQLQPTIEFLQSLYGHDLLQQALQRKPDLLLVRGVEEYQAPDALDLVEVYFRQDLKMTPSNIKKLQRTAPALFQLPMANVLTTVAYFRDILKAGSKATNDEKITQAIRKIILSHPSILHLSLTTNLQPRIEFLRQRCHLQPDDLAFLLQSSSAGILGLSVTENLAPTITFLEDILALPTKENYDKSINDHPLRKCVRAHPQLLGLSLKNLQSKVAYFDAVDNNGGRSITSGISESTINERRRPLGSKALAARILVRSPAVYSLSLRDNIIPTMDFLARIWGVSAPNAQVVAGDHLVLKDNGARKDKLGRAAPDKASSTSLASFVSEYPSILTLSLDGNILPTVNFFNRTGYISLDSDWRLVVPADTLPSAAAAATTRSSPPLRGRYIAASLFNRLLPRWHYCVTREHEYSEPDSHDTTAGTLSIDSESAASLRTDSTPSEQTLADRRPIIPLHILVSATDATFCDTMAIDDIEYLEFKREAVPRLKFSSQFDTWLKTGRPIEV